MENIKDSIMELISMCCDKRVDLNQERWKVIMELSDILCEVSTCYEPKDKFEITVYYNIYAVTIEVKNFSIIGVIKAVEKKINAHKLGISIIKEYQEKKIIAVHDIDSQGRLKALHLIRRNGDTL